MKGLEREPGVAKGFSPAQRPPPPYGGSGMSQPAEAEALRAGSELALFHLGVY